MTHQDIDLFGDPVDDPPGVAAPAAAPVNDLDLVQSVLADVLSEKTPPLHRDDAGTVRRCADPATTPTAPETAATVNQLITARYLATRRRSCPAAAHGPAVVATPAGRNAVHRWNAYRRPTSWGTPTGQADGSPGVPGGGW